MLEMFNIFCDITDAGNTLVAWMSNFAEKDRDWKRFKYKRYNYFLKALHNSGRVREMIKQHHSAQERKTWAIKKLRDRWQHHPKLQEIISD